MLDIANAYAFYRQFILDYASEKAAIYARYGFALSGSIGSTDWEVFAAILLRDRHRPGDGADLEQHEVKSALRGNSFEYQYHRDNGLQKLSEDQQVDHVFIARTADFKNVEVWRVTKDVMNSIFEGWLPELQRNYIDSQRQRFRRSVSYGFVISKGDKLVEIQAGEIIFPAGF